MIPQPIIDIAEICFQKNIKDAVVSPGSRSAPILISFVRHPEIKSWIFPDERSAGYIACGMAIVKQAPVVVICTSGTATLNLAPAIAEAYYQQIPLLILTADRPPEWIDQYDNQTINQQGIYDNYIKNSYQLPVTYDHPDDIWHVHRIVSEAINQTMEGRKGPVHINVPLREPLYPAENQVIEPSSVIKTIASSVPEQIIAGGLNEELYSEWQKYNKKLAVTGQLNFSETMRGIVETLSANDIPVVSDITSNLHSTTVIQGQDIFLNQTNNRLADLQPELLITWGKTILSKNLKSFLRKYKPVVHWHVQKGIVAADTFQSVTRIIDMAPEVFFKQMKLSGNPNYAIAWKEEENKAEGILQEYISAIPFGEFKALSMVFDHLPGNCLLHLANSMSVRYANFLTLKNRPKNITVYSNRGVSGIDGCNSFAVGTMLITEKVTILITGDLAFFYDRNAFWHNYPLNNLRIVLLNNHGGVIFRIIEGPNRQPELDEYFETRQQLNAARTAADFGFEYYPAKNEMELSAALESFFLPGSPKLLEVFSDHLEAKEIFVQLKTLIKNKYEA